jgi:hypothetical protein
VANELITRIPDPGAEPVWFVTQAWEPRFERGARDRARAALAVPTEASGWPDAYVWGAAVIARVGEASDGAVLAKALERALAAPVDAVPPENAERPESAVGIIQGALRRWPPPPGEVSGIAALLVDLEAWDGRGDAPPGWEEVVLRGLASDNPLVVKAAMSKAPPRAPSDALVAAMLPHVGTSLQATMAFRQYGSQVRPNARVLVEPVLRALDTADSMRVAPLLDVLGSLWCGSGRERSACVPKDEWLELVLARIDIDPSNQSLVQLLLELLDGCDNSQGGPAEPAEVPVLLRAWKTTLEHQRAVLHAGLLPIVPRETDPHLAPGSFQCTLESGEIWPPGREPVR